jgi:thiol-disulfide isomerase/thioredoxin
MLKKKGLWIGLVSFVVLVLAAQTAYRGLSVKRAEDTYKTLAEGDIFPAQMPLVGADGKYRSFADYAGKVVLLNYWAAWCGPCLKEMPSLYRLQEKLSRKNFALIGVDMDDDPAQGIASLARIVGAAPFPMFKGPEQAVSARFAIEGLPFTVIVDKSGKIIYARAGERDWSSPEALKFIEGLL